MNENICRRRLAADPFDRFPKHFAGFLSNSDSSKTEE